MKRIAALAFLFVFAVSASAFAESKMDSKTDSKETEGKGKTMTFEKRKETALERIDKRLSSLQEMKSCVSGAKSNEDLDACKKKFKDEREGMGMEHGHKMKK